MDTRVSEFLTDLTEQIHMNYTPRSTWDMQHGDLAYECLRRGSILLPVGIFLKLETYWIKDESGCRVHHWRIRLSDCAYI